MSKKKVTTGLIVASIISSNIATVKSVFKDDTVLNILDEDLSNKDDSSTTIDRVQIEDNAIDKIKENIDEKDSINIANNKDLIHIKDKAFLKILNTYLNKDENNTTIFKKDVEEITSLDLSNKGIEDLSGLENFTNLVSINISNNKISDISALKNIVTLKEINASNNHIFDLSSLNGLSLNKADFTMQLIKLDLLNINDTKIKIENPVKSINGMSIKYAISNNGYVKDDVFVWDNFSIEESNIEIGFNSKNNEVLFSGTINQPILIADKLILESTNITTNSDSSSWTNNDVEVFYKIPDKFKLWIETIDLPNGEKTDSLSGNFKIKENGIYPLRIYLKNSSFIEKHIKISNVDNDKPVINLLNKTTDKNLTTIEIEAIDISSGIDYILLPGGQKVYKDKIAYSNTIDGSAIFKAYDKAGNYEEITVYSQIEEAKLPKINAKDQTVMLGEDFNELLGVTATDYKGNDITSDISVSSNIDTSSLGEYIVTYNVTDSFGNKNRKDIIVGVENNMKEVEKTISRTIPNRYETLSTIENSNKTNINSMESNTSIKKAISQIETSTLNDSIYSTGIMLAMMSGFMFLFKSGRDDF